jgi:hypothetical protein
LEKMNLPSVVVAGDSVSFTESYPEYLPADGWELRYVMINAAGKIELSGAAVGNEYQFSASSLVTSAWAAGNYSVGLYALRGADDRKTLCASSIVIAPDPVAADTIDPRSSAKKTLDALMTAYDDLIASGGMVQMVSINGRTTQFRSADEILTQIKFFQQQVNAQEQAKNLRNGSGLGGRILTRFSS